jgi:hypothetical protein
MEGSAVKTPDELKKELEDAENEARDRVAGRSEQALTIGDPNGTQAEPSAFRDAWDRMFKKEHTRVEEMAPSKVIDCERVFYDTSKGLVAVYEGTRNIRLPIFHRRADGHLGAVED